MTTFLRFPDQLEFRIKAAQAGMLDPDNNLILATHAYACDEVGTIVRGGAWDPETGEAITPPVLLEGWHVNYAGPLPEGWEQYAVHPQSPVRVWA